MKSRYPISLRRQNQRGFALLVIFLMAAGVALMLYRQLPRAAFERERDKEQLLIDRGNEFIRAIRLYTNEQNKYPQSLDDLEKTNNKRYLRRRYKDPYTGKNEWRLVHTNGTQLTDSLVEAPPDINGSTENASTNTATDQSPQVNQAVIQRPSDLTLPDGTNPGAIPGANGPPQALIPGQPGFPGFPPGQVPPGQLPAGVNPQFPGGIPGQAGAQPGQTNDGKQPSFQPQFPGQQFVGQQFPGQPPPPGMRVENGQLVPMNGSQNTNNQNVNNQNGVQPGINPQFANRIPGQQAPPNGVNPQFPNQIPQTGGPGQPGVPGGGGGPQGAQTTAINLIQQLLTTPRQAPVGIQQSNNTISGGIAGVASTHTGPSIKVFNERQRYEEWEFVYQVQNALGGNPGPGGANPPPQSGTDPPNRTPLGR